MFIGPLIRKIKLKIINYKVTRFVTLKGINYNFREGALVILADGSNKNDIVIGDNFTLYGTISSQTGGKIKIGCNTRLGRNSIIRSVNFVEIGNYTAIADNVVITDNNNHPEDAEFRRKMKLDSLGGDMRLWKYSKNAPIIIGENVWIGENSRIQKGVKIGDNSIIAAGAIVTKNVPSNSIVGGVPAKVISYINESRE
jgi:acetyltransferase-like isoleucine patch superfamily enzyme